MRMVRKDACRHPLVGAASYPQARKDRDGGLRQQNGAHCLGRDGAQQGLRRASAFRVTSILAVAG